MSKWWDGWDDVKFAGELGAECSADLEFATPTSLTANIICARRLQQRRLYPGEKSDQLDNHTILSHPHSHHPFFDFITHSPPPAALHTPRSCKYTTLKINPQAICRVVWSLRKLGFCPSPVTNRSNNANSFRRESTQSIWTPARDLCTNNSSHQIIISSRKAFP